MLLDHNHIDRLGISERQKAETSRAPCGTIPHDGTFLYLAELRKVVL